MVDWRAKPTLILQPAADVIAAPANVQNLLVSLGARASLVTIDDAGHALLPEQPAAGAIDSCNRSSGTETRLLLESRSARLTRDRPHQRGNRQLRAHSRLNILPPSQANPPGASRRLMTPQCC